MTRRRRPSARPLTGDEARALWHACGKGWRGKRDRALLALLWRGGLRAGEAVAQLREDLREEGKHYVVRVSRPKGFERGAPQREVGLDVKSSQVLRAWLAANRDAYHELESERILHDKFVTLRAPQACAGCSSELHPQDQARKRVFIMPDGAFFSQYYCLYCNERWHTRVEPTGKLRGGVEWLLFTGQGKPLQTSHVRRWLPMLARRAGLDRRVHPHCLRHTFARELYDEGVGIREIQLALGHGSLATTEAYLKSIGAHEVVAATTRREW